jgi:phospholipase C
MRAGMTRREVLRAGAGVGVAALSADPLIRAAYAFPPRWGRVRDIEHVVILIQENRSFDHYFGTLPGVRGFSDRHGRRTLFQPGYPAPGFSGVLLPFHLDTRGAPQCFPDITHKWVAQHQSWDGGKLDGFVRAHLAFDGPEAGPATMGYYQRADIPFYFALAEAFTTCDGYHCSVLGPTDPNRLYSVSATIDPDGDYGGPLVETLGPITRALFAGRFTWTTMPEQLSAGGVSWKVYTGAGLGVYDNVLTYFHAYHTRPDLAAAAFDPVYPNDFVADLASGELPEVSWINMSVNQTEHPGYSTAAAGEDAVEMLLGTLLAHPDVWEKTALFLTWDENGGFFDHVAPLVPPVGTRGEYLTVRDVTGNAGGITGPIGLGFRVPMIVVSPFSRGGFLCSDAFDHTSILRFLETRFGVEVPNLSQWRREVTGDLTSAFNFRRPDTSKPELPLVKGVAGGGCAVSGPVVVPPNSLPQQPRGHIPHPSGPSHGRRQRGGKAQTRPWAP